MQDRSRVAVTSVLGGCRADLSAEVADKFVSAAGLVWPTFRKLWIVPWRMLVKYQHVFMCAEWTPPRVQETGGSRLFPDPLVAEPGPVTHAEQLVEWALGSEQYCASWANDAFVLAPQILKIHRRVPIVFGDTVRRVGQDKVYGSIRQHGHALKAVHAVNPVDGEALLGQDSAHALASFSCRSRHQIATYGFFAAIPPCRFELPRMRS